MTFGVKCISKARSLGKFVTKPEVGNGGKGCYSSFFINYLKRQQPSRHFVRRRNNHRRQEQDADTDTDWDPGEIRKSTGMQKICAPITGPGDAAFSPLGKRVTNGELTEITLMPACFPFPRKSRSSPAAIFVFSPHSISCNLAANSSSGPGKAASLLSSSNVNRESSRVESKVL